MNEAHPFREGNGRTQRVIVGQLAAHHDHPIAWRVCSPIQNIELSIAAVDDPQVFARPSPENFSDIHSPRVRSIFYSAITRERRWSITCQRIYMGPWRWLAARPTGWTAWRIPANPR